MKSLIMNCPLPVLEQLHVKKQLVRVHFVRSLLGGWAAKYERMLGEEV